MIVRLFREGMRVPFDALPRGGSLAFTFVGIFVAIAITIATVFMGNQLMPLFALIAGWAEGFLVYSGDRRRQSFDLRLVPVPAYRFARVVQ
jgi:drug/metabolite transporter (DMT)-like permease